MILNLPQFKSIILLLCLTLSSVVFSQTLEVLGNSAVISNGDVTPDVSDDTDYGDVALGSLLSHTFNLANIHNSTNLTGLTLTVAGSTDFSPSSIVIGTIRKSKNEDHVITFTPTSLGIVSATITITGDNGNTPYTFTIQGNGVIPPPEIDVTGLGNSIINADATPDVIDDTEFGNVGTGSTLDHTFTIENTGNPSTTLNLDGSPIVSISGAAEFTISSQPSATTITGGNSLTFVVRFSPTAAVASTAIISIDNDDSDEDPYTFTIQGTGVVPIAEIDIVDSGANPITNGSADSPSALNNTDMGSTDSTNPIAITYTIENTGTADLTISSATSDNTDFVITTAPSGTVTAGNFTTFTITYTPSSIATTTAIITILSNDADESPYTFTVEGTGTETPMIAAGGVWSYLDTGVDQGAAWYGVGFDYSTWASGNAELGYGDGGEATVVSFGGDSANKYPTTYFKKSFTASASDAANATLVMRALRDDGMVVYIDGVEVWRDNMPTGIISYTTLSSSTISEPEWIEFKILNILSAGSHEISVEIHQRSAGSSDLSFNFEMYTDNSYVFVPPPAPDEDGDGVANYVDSDDDSDGIPDVTEGCYTANFVALNRTGGEDTLLGYFPITNHPLDDGNLVDMDITGTYVNITSYLAGEHDWAMRFRGGPTLGTFTMDFHNPVDDLFFKLVDFDENETWTVDAYDDSGALIDLTVSDNVYHKGTYIDQNGNTFNDNNFGGNNNGDIFASDIYGSVYFYFPATSISKIVFSIDQPDGSTIRLAAMHFCGLDTDDDGIGDYFDSDSDNDGIPDLVEAGGFDTDGDGKIDDLTDTDGDGLADTYDTTPNVYFAYEVTSIQDYDFDGDGIPNRIDLDADGDGILDLIEVGLTDADGNGMIDGFTDTNDDGYHDSFDGAGSQLITGTDAGGDGMPDTYPNKNPDGNGFPNFMDIDSDDDGITDNTEAQPTGSYINLVTTDTDGDGIPDVFDSIVGFGGAGLTPEDTDGDGTPDYLDLDSDNSEEPDAIEGHDMDGDGAADASSNANLGVFSGSDADGDGLDDGYDNTATYDPTNVGLKAIDHPIFDAGSDRDWRWSQVALDFDGVNDHVDFNDEHDLLGSFTLESWVLQEQTVANGTIISKGNVNSGNKKGYFLTLQNSFPSLTWYSSGGAEKINIISPFAISNDRWYHIAAIFDGTTATLFIDGIEVGDDSTSGSPGDFTEKCIIGASYDSDTPTIPTNYFDGFIDEVRIWDVALTTNQMREMMNQEIEQNGTAVRGKVIPRDISGGLLWDDLKGYYDMNDDDADDKSSKGKHGSPKNITTLQEQTAPLPYTTKQDGDWEDNTGASPWTLGSSVWDEPNGLGVDGTLIDWNIVVTSHNVDVNRNVKLLGLVSESIFTDTSEENITDSELTIGEDGNDYELNITHYLKLDGKIDLQNESQLIQGEGSWLDEDSSGYLERDQQGTANSFTYNYWGSPVSKRNISANNVAHKSGEVLRDGHNGGDVVGSLDFFIDGPAITADPYFADGSAAANRKIATYWIWKFVNNQTNDYANWEWVGNYNDINVTEGFTMKGISGASAIADDQNYVFRGKPNNVLNGDSEIIHTAFTAGFDTNGNPKISLAANPFPSALDATEFINDNSSVIQGQLYFWEHWGGGTHKWAEYQGGYAIRNLSAGVPAVSHPDVDQTDDRIIKASPTQYVPVAQGFYVIQKHDTPSSPTNPQAGNVIFKNSQRIFKTEGAGESIFTKGSDSKNKDSKQITTKEDNEIIRIDFTSPTGFHRQIATAFVEGATDEIDYGYDAYAGDFLPNDAFFIKDDNYLVIQSFGEFDAAREIPISIFIDEESQGGVQKISLVSIENFNQNIEVYIKDNQNNGETFDITNNDFEIQLEPGEHKDRFSLVFQSRLLTMDELPRIEDGFNIFMNNQQSEININRITDVEVKSATLINMLGQTIQVWTKGLQQRNLQLPVNTSTGGYILNLHTLQGIISKKLVIE